MDISSLSIAGAAIITIHKHVDEQGSFSQLLYTKDLERILSDDEIVQINYSKNNDIGTIRGLHFQLPPKSEKKFITCIQGRVFDVIVDVRRGSPTFLKWEGREISSDNNKLIVIPKGCAHGFQVMEENSELLYFHTEYYDPAYEGAISARDPRIAINWPLPIGKMSDRDRNHPFISEDFTGVVL